MSLAAGVCALGERMALGVGGSPVCVPFYPFPNALQTELFDDSAQTWHAPAKEKRRTVLDARTFDKDK